MFMEELRHSSDDARSINAGTEKTRTGQEHLGAKLGPELTSDSGNRPRTQAAQETMKHPKMSSV